MNSLLVKKFKGKHISSFVWIGKGCWIAIEIARLLEYQDPSYAVVSCIDNEHFRLGIEYDVITGAELKFLKSLFDKETSKAFKYAPKLILFYEQGLYGFLQYSQKPLGLTFRMWIREQVLPSLKERGAYVIDEESNFEAYAAKLDTQELAKDKLLGSTKVIINKLRDTISNESGFDVDKFQRVRTTLEMIKVFKEMLDEMTDDVTYKFEFLKAICTEAGMALPIFADGDDVI